MKIIIYQKGKWEFNKFVALKTLDNQNLIQRGFWNKSLPLKHRLLYLFKLLLDASKVPQKAKLTLEYTDRYDKEQTEMTVNIEAISHYKNISEVEKMVFDTNANHLTIYCKDL